MITTIKDGQKLQDGDWFYGTIEQYNAFLRIENHEIMFSPRKSTKGIVSDTDSEGKIILMTLYDGSCATDPINEYSFEAFKKLCENTFGDGK